MWYRYFEGDLKFTGGFRVSFANGVLVGNCNELSESQTPHFPGNQYPEIPSASNTLQLATIPPIHGVFVAGRTTTAQVRRQSNEKNIWKFGNQRIFSRPAKPSICSTSTPSKNKVDKKRQNIFSAHAVPFLHFKKVGWRIHRLEGKKRFSINL